MSILKRIVAICAVVLVLGTCILTAFADTSGDDVNIPLLKRQRASGYADGIANGYKNDSGAACDCIADFQNVVQKCPINFVAASSLNQNQLVYNLYLNQDVNPSTNSTMLAGILIDPQLVPFIRQLHIAYFDVDGSQHNVVAAIRFSTQNISDLGLVDDVTAGNNVRGVLADPDGLVTLGGNTINWDSGTYAIIYIPARVYGITMSGTYNRIQVQIDLPYFPPSFSVPASYESLIDEPFDEQYHATTVLGYLETIVEAEPLRTLFTLVCFLMLAAMLLTFLR